MSAVNPTMNQQVKITAGSFYFGRKGTVIAAGAAYVFVGFARSTKDGVKVATFSFPASFVTAV